jgi:tRNA (guanine37-N1)-methyltransferase
MIHFQVITLFPEFMTNYLKEGVVSQAFAQKLATLNLINPRQFAVDGHRSVDDRPYGGGDGMVMMAEVLEKAMHARPHQDDHVIYLSPQGSRLTEKKVISLAKKPSLTLIAGRYAGVDQRFLNQYVHEEISIGDFVLSGGELPALCLMDAILRKIPGVLGHGDSAEKDSFASEQGLEGPLFTRPLQWQEQQVPAILLSGHHQKIEEWKKKMSDLITWIRRPDLGPQSPVEKQILKKFFESLTDEDKKSCGLNDVKLPGNHDE